jgi:hypothetical protein
MIAAMARGPDQSDVHSFARTFFGYGTWRAPFWFIGMEEGGVRSIRELAIRIDAWKERSGAALVDLIGHRSSFTRRAA